MEIVIEEGCSRIIWWYLVSSRLSLTTKKNLLFLVPSTHISKASKNPCCNCHRLFFYRPASDVGDKFDAQEVAPFTIITAHCPPAQNPMPPSPIHTRIWFDLTPEIIDDSSFAMQLPVRHTIPPTRRVPRPGQSLVGRDSI